MPPATIPDPPRAALAHLRRADKRLAAAIDRVGPFAMKQSPANLRTVCRCIIGQQLSTVVADAIARKFDALATTDGETTPERLLSLPESDLRAAGLSNAKTLAVLSLAEFWREHRLDSARLAAMPDDEIIALLTQVKGIGPWTAKMVLMFALRRPDVLPAEDLGVRIGLQKVHALHAPPTPREVLERTQAWRPWRSIGSWYCWQVLK